MNDGCPLQAGWWPSTSSFRHFQIPDGLLRADTAFRLLTPGNGGIGVGVVILGIVAAVELKPRVRPSSSENEKGRLTLD